MNWNTHTGFTELNLALELFAQTEALVSGWTLAAKQSDGRQSLLLGQAQNNCQVYQDRLVEETSFNVEIFTGAADAEKIGTAKGSIDPSFDITLQLRTLLNNAQLTLNPYFKMAAKPASPYPEVQSADPILFEDLDQAHQGLLQRISQHCLTLENVVVNSAELFSNRHNHIYVTSTGIRAEQQSTDIYFEVALEKQPKPNVQEVFKYWHCVGLEDCTIEEFLDTASREAQFTEQSELPPTLSSATILLDSYAISKFIAALSSQLNASAEYSQGPHLQPGDLASKNASADRSDLLTLRLDPSVALMAKTTGFTNDGEIAQAATVIDKNIVTQQIIDSRMAQYLGKAANNISGNLVVALGSVDKDALLAQADDVIELLDLSSLLVNPVSMTWSSEIKLALRHRRGQEAVVLKGGIVSGNVRDNLGGFKFSNEQTKRNTIGGYFEAANGYIGPRHMLIWQGVTLTGQEDKA